MDIVERNLGSYLGSGDIIKPRFYFTFAFVFGVLSVLWLAVVNSKGFDRFD